MVVVKININLLLNPNIPLNTESNSDIRTTINVYVNRSSDYDIFCIYLTICSFS